MRLLRPVLTIAFALLGSAAAVGDDTKDEIRIGQTLPYSGPASGFGIIGRAQEAYFEKVNAEGGINGRKVKFISLDDAEVGTKNRSGFQLISAAPLIICDVNLPSTTPNMTLAPEAFSVASCELMVGALVS